MKCKMCLFQKLFIPFTMVMAIVILYNVKDEYYDETMHQFLSMTLVMFGIAISFYVFKIFITFIWGVFKKARFRNILISTFVILMLTMILFPPYIIINKNHIPIQTGYDFLFLLDEINYMGYAATVNIQLLLIQLFISLVIFWVLFFRGVAHKSQGKEQTAII